jgi:outer membrane biogenesis lipoprotein LolB
MKVFLIALCAMILSACASTQDKSSMAESKATNQRHSIDPATQNYHSDIDWDYVKRVERIAGQRGVSVKWVQMPRKKQTEVATKP